MQMKDECGPADCQRQARAYSQRLMSPVSCPATRSASCRNSTESESPTNPMTASASAQAAASPASLRAIPKALRFSPGVLPFAPSPVLATTEPAARSSWFLKPA